MSVFSAEMEGRPPCRESEPATCSGRDWGSATMLKGASLAWSGVCLAPEDSSWVWRQSVDNSLLSFSFEDLLIQTSEVTNRRTGLQKPFSGIRRAGFDDQPCRSRGRGVRLVVDSNSAFDLAAPLLQKAETSWEKDVALEPIPASNSDALTSDSTTPVFVENDLNSKKASEHVGLRRRKRWQEALLGTSLELLRRLPKLNPEAMNTCKHLFSGAMAAAVAR